MDKNTKIYVAGHHGLVGSAIWNNLQRRGYTNLVGRSHKELDLLDGVAVKQFFDEDSLMQLSLPLRTSVVSLQTCSIVPILSIRISRFSRM